MKRTLIGTALAAMLCLGLAGGLLAGGAGLKVKVIVASANVRAEASLQGTVVASAKRDEVFEVLEKAGDWYKIQWTPEKAGWISSRVVQELPAEAGDAPAEPAKIKVKPKAKPVEPEPETPARRPKPEAAEEEEAPEAAPFKRLYVRVGGGYGMGKTDLANATAFSIYYEDGSVSEAYALDSAGVAIDAGLGFMFTRNFGLELSFVPESGKNSGSFSASVPHPFYFNSPRTATWTQAMKKTSGFELNLDLVAAFPAMSRLNLYIQAGGTYFMGIKVDRMSDLSLSEVAYPFDQVTLTPSYSAASASAFGFNGGLGLDYFMSDSFAVNLNGRYSSGTVKVPAYTLGDPKDLSVKLGGLRATAGIKVAF